MENAVEALIMAGEIFIFLIALTVCLSSFSTLRNGIDRTLSQTETVEMAQNSGLFVNYISSSRAKATRVIGGETLVSSMYRAIKENYVIYIKLKDTSISNLKTKEIVKDETLKFTDDKMIKITIGSNQKINAILKGRIL